MNKKIFYYENTIFIWIDGGVVLNLVIRWLGSHRMHYKTAF